MKKFKIETFFLTSVIIGSVSVLLASFAFAKDRPEKEFIYDSRGKRDPFISLLDKDSLTGLRTKFSPPEVGVRLPLEMTVKGILWNGKEFFAIINDEVMKKGQNIGEVKIKEIEKNRVILEYGEREFTVFLMKEKEK